MLRTHTCGALRLKLVGKEVRLCGWAHRLRHMGKLLWVELRDRYGRTQLLFEQGRSSQEVWALALQLGREDVLQVRGQVVARAQRNADLPTGDIEVRVLHMERLSVAEVPPFVVDEPTDGGELLRLQHRYLDLRRPPLQRNLLLRHQLSRSIRSFLDAEDFIEVETPQLVRSTPEGARDFVVPARLHPGQHYALPQSPQLFKQLLMVGGLDKYYQLARCFRDEDHRSDRQPEFTQLDAELSFVEQEDILQLFEALMVEVFHKTIGYRLKRPFARISYAEAMERYGTDKPDLRYGLPLKSLSAPLESPPALSFLRETLRALVLPAAARMGRKQLDAWRQLVCSPQLGAETLVYVRVGAVAGQHESPLAKHFSAEAFHAWVMSSGAQAGDLLLVVAGGSVSAAAALRAAAADTDPAYDPKKHLAAWIIDFPLFDKEPASDTLQAMHHPFTAPHPDDLQLLSKDPLSVRAQAYDLVIDGIEIGGGSLRITNKEVQEQVFAALGYEMKEVRAQFGFLLHAFRYGVPPHGGIAMGIDRLCALLAGEPHIRDCIAFPKNTAGRDLMLNAPAPLQEAKCQEKDAK